MEERGRRIEDQLAEAYQFIPRFARTYVDILLRPRQYFSALRDGATRAHHVTPAAFWLVNVAAAKILQVVLEPGRTLPSWQQALDLSGLMVGTALFAWFCVALLDVRGPGSFRLMLRIVFAGSITFVPLEIVSLLPMPEDFISTWLAPVLQGSESELRWFHWLPIILSLLLVVVWFVIVGTGARVAFRRSSLAVGLCLSACVAFAVTALAILLGLGAVRGYQSISIAQQHLARARAAALQTPPDYYAAAQAFKATYESKSPLLTRHQRVGARIGQAAAGRAMAAILLKQPRAEKTLYDSLLAALAGRNEDAAHLLFQATEAMERDPALAKWSSTQDETDLQEIRRFLSDARYDPLRNGKKGGRARLRIPAPTLFP
jgi:hypothetical protein